MIAGKMITGVSLVLLLAACGNMGQRARVQVSEDSTFLTGTIYLVRHAEKDKGEDPSLTAAGRKRAGALYRLLKDSSISRIYCTPYKRSVQTGDSLRILNRIDTAFYKPDATGESLIYEISRRGDWGKHILVIAHSNTMLPILKSLNARTRMDSIADTDYGNIFIVHKTSAASKVQHIRLLLHHDGDSLQQYPPQEEVSHGKVDQQPRHVNKRRNKGRG
ncbi:SixA phosphatase family protein [Chitinophaga cymbidii]|uniref:Histidine phosphatase family protein n=1 Tax=Chitinophaga cymbidii TaxID=1096750 RepID=A0A512RDI9_9BACT|nr:histidine phosphatase family protein [Chitinophaga cymbidii]GEP93778.1 hypothetical protein CCY01nite_00380 [Chitinophaga cymbidii]